MKKVNSFMHGSNPSNNPKFIKLINKFGHEGYGIFWMLIEVLHEQENLKFPKKLIPDLAAEFDTTPDKIISVVEDFDLFDLTDEENFSFKSIPGVVRWEDQ